MDTTDVAGDNVDGGSGHDGGSEDGDAPQREKPQGERVIRYVDATGHTETDVFAPDGTLIETRRGDDGESDTPDPEEQQ